MGYEQAAAEKQLQMEARDADSEILNKKENGKIGWILEVDLKYPQELHEEHDSFPLAPEKKISKKEWMSPYQRRLIKDLDLSPPDSEKLLLTLQDKNNYVVHYRNLQFYLKQGMKLKRVHRVLEFGQECWMKSYIRMNTKFRKKRNERFRKELLQAYEQLGVREDHGEPAEPCRHKNSAKQ